MKAGRPRRLSVYSAADVEAMRGRIHFGDSAAFIETNFNRKISPVDLVPVPGRRPRPVARAPFACTTSVSIQATCPDSCTFKTTPEGRNGCFADAGFTLARGQRMDAAAQGRDGLEVVREEAYAIRRAFGGGWIPQDGKNRRGRDLRIHVGGDVHSIAGVVTLVKAVFHWLRRGGGAVWTFTHWWREIPRATWGPISVLASVEDEAGVRDAVAAGYAPALVVDRFPDGSRPFRLGGARFIPCPAEVRDTTCVECRLCLDRPLAQMGLGIAFQVHGPTAQRAADHLVRIRTGKNTA